MKIPFPKLAGLFREEKLDAYLVSQDTNIRYLTSYPSKESWLFLSLPSTRAHKIVGHYLTDFRYIDEARKSLKGFRIYRYERSLYDGVGALSREMKVKTLGFDPCHITVDGLDRLKKALPASVRLKPVKGLIERLRLIKTAEEVAAIKKAIRVNLEAFQAVSKVLKPGTSEKDILNFLEKFVKDRGLGFSFDPIIAFGPDSALPHARVTGRKLKNRDIALLDVGIDQNGYKSDLTRMFFLGKIPQLIQAVYAIVCGAQRSAIAKIRPGVRASDVDEEARNYLKRYHLDKFFGHSLGHGVGLDIHESPRLSPTSDAILTPGMIVTVEPAVYFTDRFGIRVEDMVLVTQKGCEVLSGIIN